MTQSSQDSTERDEIVLACLREMKESVLTETILMPLLKKMGSSHIEYVHGPSERGKDLKYVSKDFYGDQVLSVSQVKNHKFSGSATSPLSIVFTLNQLLQCKKTKVLNPNTNRKELPSEVTLITTYDFPDVPLADADPMLDEVERTCKIITPDKLLRLLNQHLPNVVANLAYPGETFSRALLRYVSVYQEAAAFELPESRLLRDYFVNLGMALFGDDGNLVDTVLRRQTLTAMPIHIPKDIDDAIQLLYQQLPGELSGDELYHIHKSHQKDNSLLNQVKVTSFKVDRYLQRLEEALSGVSDNGGTEESPSPVSTALDMILLTELIIRIILDYKVLHSGEGDVVHPDSWEAPPIELRSVEPEVLLETKNNICLVGQAGAGKTCIARTIARIALERQIKCIYFPCFRIIDDQAELYDEIIAFIELLCTDSSISAADVLSQAEVIIIDGCDEAASFTTRLGDDISELCMQAKISIPYSETKEKAKIPIDLHEMISIDEKKRKIAIKHPVSTFDLDSLVNCNEGTSFEPIFSEIRACNERLPKIIVTSRDAGPLNLPRSYQHLCINPFDDEQLEEFFSKAFQDEPEKCEELLEFLNENTHINEICRTPMVATLLSALHWRNIDLPKSRTDIYDKRFEMLLGRWDSIRSVPARVQVEPKDKRLYLSRLSLWLHTEHLRRFTRSDAETIWKSGFERVYNNIDFDTFIEELRLSDNLIYPEGGDEFSLGHLSYQEYLAALGIVLGQRFDVLVDRFYDPWWQMVLLFYSGITGDISRLLDSMQARHGLDMSTGLVDQMLNEARFTSDVVRSFISDYSAEEEDYVPNFDFYRDLEED